jgi:hypothetical protein
MRRWLIRLVIAVLLVLLLVTLVVAAIWPDRPPRTDSQAELFQGVTYTCSARMAPRPLMIHIVEIDLSAPGIRLLVTPGDESSGMDLYAQTTGAFLAEAGVQVAVNGSFFEPFRPGFLLGFASEPNRGDPVSVKGLSISDGEIYSEDYPELPVLCLSNGRAEIRAGGCTADTRQALAGNPIFVEHGAPVVHERSAYHRDPHPRTAVAVDAGGRTLWLIVVDGRQPDYSEGATLAELADITLELGVETALNLDGGGSSTLVAEGADGPYLLNAPIHTRLVMRERPVANHLGVYALPMGEAGR